jgi:hypothetical protein
LQPSVSEEETPKRRQLSLFDEMDVVHGLVAGTQHARMTACQQLWLRRSDPSPELRWKRSEYGTWASCDLASCNVWGCPRCGRARASEARDELGATIGKHLNASVFTDAWMLTLTNPHYDAGVVVDVGRLYDACARLYRDPEFVAWSERWGVVGRVRCLDNTRGQHPHFHIAVLVEHALIGMTSPIKGMGAVERAEWLDYIAAELIPAWERACRAAGVEIRDLDAFHQYGLKLSGGEHAAAYFVGWGLVDEVSLSPYKGQSHLSLLPEAKRGDVDAGAKYLAWLDATKGKQWVSGLADARRRLEVTDDEIEAFAKARRERLQKERPRELVKPISISIPRELADTALRLGWGIVLGVADKADANGDNAQRAVLSLLWRAFLDHRGLRGANATAVSPPRSTQVAIETAVPPD